MRYVASILLLIGFCMPLALMAQSNQGADQIIGIWLTEDDEAKVKIYRKGDTFSGKLIWAEGIESGEESGFDEKNPKKRLRSRKLIGLDILHAFKYEGDNVWKEGKIYDPDNGKTYSCKMKLTKDGKLDVRGFIGFSIIGRTTVWRKSE